MDKEEKKKKTEQKDELMENDRCYPVEQVSNTGEPTKKEVKAAVKELNPSFHGLSEQLYEYTSAAANNGSGFEGLGDNTYFWNYTTSWTLILGRFLPIVGQVAIAGLLAGKKYVPESAGTLKTDTVTFGVMTFAVIFIVAALSFFPAHALSTIAEHFSL